jgi:hypothetical protein
MTANTLSELEQARADLQNLRDILLSQVPLTKMPGTTVDLLRQLVQQRDSARAKAIQFDLDRAGIEQRAAEAAELVDLRAEVERLRDVLQGLAHWVSNLATDDQLARPAHKASKSGREWLGEAVDAARNTLS